MPNFSVGSAYLQIVPTLLGDKAAIQRQLDQMMAGTKVEVPVLPEVDQRKLADVEAALSRIPDPRVQVDLDDNAANAKLVDLRSRLEALRDKRIGVDIDATQASAQLAEIQAELDRVGAEHPDVQVRADVAEASAQLATVQAECDRIAAEHPNVQVSADTGAADAELAATRAGVGDLDGKRATFSVSDGGSASQSRTEVSNLAAAGVALGPALIPVAAAAAAALASIGSGAIAGIAGIGALKLAFSGVGSALKDMDTAQTASGDTAQKAAQKQVSSANAVASAQSQVASAVASLKSAQENAADAEVKAAAQVQKAQESLARAREQAANQAVQSAEAIRKAEEGVATAQEQASRQVASAIQSQRAAEQTLTTAVKDAQRAQEALTQARQDAIRTLADLQMQTEDGALAQRQAALDVTKAQQDLAKTTSDPAADGLQRQQAQLTYDQAVQQLKDITAKNGQLAQDKKQADAQGVEGSKQVQTALDGVAASNQRIKDAQQGVATSAQAVAQAQRDGAKSVADAEQGVADARRQAAQQAQQSAEQVQSAEVAVTDAQRAQAQQARQSGEQIASAQRGVADAMRSAAQAGQQAATGTDAASSGAKKLAQDMAALSPAGRDFVTFLHSLKPQFDELKSAAQSGLFPGLEQGIKNVMPQFGLFKDIIGNAASAMGGLARDAGAALNDPFWTRFFGWVRDTAGPSITVLGRIFGDVFKGIAGLMQATSPLFTLMMNGVKGLADRFAAFGASAAGGTSSGFNAFMGYVRDNIPRIMQLVRDLGPAISNLIAAIRPFGGLSLGALDLFVKLIAAIPPAVLTPILGAIGGIVLALKGFSGIASSVKAVTDGIAALKVVGGGIATVVGAIKDFEIGSKLAAAAQWLWNIALDANPIGLIILGIAALVVAVIYAYTHFQSFRDIVNGCWDGIKAATAAVVGWFQGPFVDWWNGLGAWWNGFWSGVSSFFTGIWQAIQNTAVTFWNNLSNFWTGGLNAFSSFWVSVWNNISSFFSGIWNTLTNTAVNAWNAISSWFGSAFNAFTGFFRDTWNNIAGIFGNIWNGIKGTAQNIWDGIVGVVRGAVNGVIDAADWMVDQVNKVLGFLHIPQIPHIPRLEAGGVIAFESGGVLPPLLQSVIPQYASGTSRIGGGFTTNTPMAIVGEGGPHKEYVIPTDPKYKGRATALYSMLGSDLGVGGGVPRMADGGILGWLGDAAGWVSHAVGGAWNAVTGALGDVAQWAGGGIDAIKGQIEQAVSSIIPDGMLKGAGAWLADQVIPAVETMVQSAMAAMSGASMGPMSASHTLDIVNAAKSKGVPHAGAVIAVMTGLQESGLRVLANPNVPASMGLWHEGVGHDHDSVGIFQQRQSWGPTSLLMNPFGSAQLFFNKLGHGPYGSYGAEAQRVQVSAYPGAYSKWQGQAEGLVGGAGYDSGGYLPPGLTLAFNGTTRPEPVFTGSQWDTLQSAGGDGANGPTVNVYPAQRQDERSIGIAAARRLAWEGKVALP